MTVSIRIDHSTYLKQPASDYLSESEKISHKLHDLSEAFKLLSSTIQTNNKSIQVMLDKGLTVSEEISALRVCQTETIELLHKVAGEIESYRGYERYSHALSKIEEYEFAHANCNFYLKDLIRENAKLIEQFNNYFDETLSISKKGDIPFGHVKKLCVLFSEHYYKVKHSRSILIRGLGKTLDTKWKNIKKLLLANCNLSEKVECFEGILIVPKNQEIPFVQVEKLYRLVSNYKVQIEKPSQYLLKTLRTEVTDA